MSSPNDTDHDGDCHLCHRLPGGCFLRDVAAPLQTVEPKFCIIDETDPRPLQFLECPRPSTATAEFIQHLIDDVAQSTRYTTSD